MKTIYLNILAILLGCHNLYSQVLLQPQIPSPGVFTKSQLWNISIMNSFNHSMNVRVVMTMSDLSSNQLVLSGTSRFFTLNQGATQLTHQTISPINYQAINANYPVDAQPDGFLPVGIFSICYTLYWQNNDGLEPVSEQCELLEIEPLSPPLLIIPENEQKLTEQYPFFTWTIPMTSTLLSGLRYDWKLVEVLPFQSPGDALQQNTPIWMQRSLTNNSYQYPYGQTPLDSSKLYAWQVTALSNITPVATSEVWTFRIGAPLLTSEFRKRGAYAKLNSTTNGSALLIAGEIQFIYNNQTNQNQISAMIYDYKNSRKYPLFRNPIVLPVSHGENYVRIPSTMTKSLKNGHPYLLEVIGDGRRYYLKLQFTSNR